MSLLLDARKKSQQAQSAQAGNGSQPASPAAPSSDAPLPDNRARIAGQNLFNAKSRAPSFARAGINPILLSALGGTVLLLTAGAGYVWYSISPGNTQPTRPISTPAAASLEKPGPATSQPENRNNRNNGLVGYSTWIQVMLTRCSGWPSSRSVAAWITWRHTITHK